MYRSLVMRPGEEAVEGFLTWDDVSEIIDGLVEPVEFGENVMLLVNEEFRLNGSEKNRVILDENGLPADIYCGNIVAVSIADDEEDFGSLTDEQIEYLKKVLPPRDEYELAVAEEFLESEYVKERERRNREALTAHYKEMFGDDFNVIFM